MIVYRLEEMLADPAEVPEPLRFHGPAFSSPVASAQTSKATAALIRLPRGSRGHWHRHADGQVIHVVAGSGLVGRRSRDPLEIGVGDIVWIEPGEEHWHGSGAADLAQLAYSFGPITWLEPSP